MTMRIKIQDLAINKTQNRVMTESSTVGDLRRTFGIEASRAIKFNNETYPDDMILTNIPNIKTIKIVAIKPYLGGIYYLIY